ncbi:MAG: gamma-glutamylcyclotransferase family protein [Aquisalimonadaceae bacterium]
MMCADRVFVYGSLRRGGTNHRFLKGGRLLGGHRTEPHFRMLNLGRFPGVVQPGTTAIIGEVYGVNRRVLAALDVLEDYPRSYTRSRIATPWGDAWIYLYLAGRQRFPEIAGGDWLPSVV